MVKMAFKKTLVFKKAASYWTVMDAKGRKRNQGRWVSVYIFIEQFYLNIVFIRSYLWYVCIEIYKWITSNKNYVLNAFQTNTFVQKISPQFSFSSIYFVGHIANTVVDANCSSYMFLSSAWFWLFWPWHNSVFYVLSFRSQHSFKRLTSDNSFLQSNAQTNWGKSNSRPSFVFGIILFTWKTNRSVNSYTFAGWRCRSNSCSWLWNWSLSTRAHSSTISIVFHRRSHWRWWRWCEQSLF